MHVLIVEDDPALGNYLGHGLELDGHEVALVGDGEAALTYTVQRRPEVMILDLGLPQKDGLEVLAEMGHHFPSTSVMVLTGRAEMEERVRCLDLGADDVVLKPFSFHELRARLNALCRRRRRFEGTVLRFGDLEMDRAERKVKLAGRGIDLTATEFSLLESLLRRQGERICSRIELLREVWQTPQGMGTNIVEVYINYLRRKLDRCAAPGPRHQSVIRTVRGEGYVLQTPGGSARTAGKASQWVELETVQQRVG